MRYATLLACILLMTICCLNQPLLAQTFNLYDIDTSRFPTISARILALDSAGQEFPNLTASDFSIAENGKPMTTGLQVHCNTVKPSPANVVMVVDRSASMSTVVNSNTNETRLNWAQAGVAEYINNFGFIPPSSIALLSFSSGVRLESDFRNSRTPLLSALQQITPLGSTKYDPFFLDSTIGAIKLLSQKDAQYPRIIILLTDGDPDVTPKTDSIIALCQRYSITVFAITLGIPSNTYLDQICASTGGRVFSAFTKQTLLAVYEFLAAQTVIQSNCTIEWSAPYGCDEQSRIRTIAAQFLRTSTPLNTSLPYVAPRNSLASPSLSQSIVYMGNPAANTSTTQEISIKAINAPFHVDGLMITPTGYFDVVDMQGKSLPFVLNVGETWKPIVRFKQDTSKAYRQALLLVQGSPCQPAITLFGGIGEIRVVSPNGKENYTGCDSIDIQWAGVEPNQPVSLFYTTDGNNNNPQWTLITTTATGLSYKWMPPQVGTSYRIRVVVSNSSIYQWSRSIGGVAQDTCRSIAIDANNAYVMVAGSFEQKAYVTTTPPVQLSSLGGSDVFVARYDADGNPIWAISGGGNLDDRASCVTADSAGGIYAAGYYKSPTMMLGTQTLSMPNTFDKSNAWVAKFDTAGSTVWALRGGGSATAEGYAVVDSIAYYLGNILIQGRYNQRLRFGSRELYHSPFPAGTLYNFWAFINKDGTVLNLAEGMYPGNIPFTKASVTDKNDYIYETGGFTGTLKSGSLVNNSAGAYDVYVRKTKFVLNDSDISDTVFSVTLPRLSTSVLRLDAGKAAVGLSTSTTYRRLLCNTGTIAFVISSAILSGVDASEFRLVTNLNNRFLQPGDCVDVELLFSPMSIGNRSAVLTITGACPTPLVLPIDGLGLPACSFSTATPLLDSSVTNSSKQHHETCLLRNEGTQTYSGLLTLNGTNAEEFTVIITATACTLNVKNTDGCAFTLSPKQCLEADILFTPKDVGLRFGNITVKLPKECGDVAEIPLLGKGLSTQTNVQDGVHNSGSTIILAGNVVPNPARGISSIPYTLGTSGALRIELFDFMGVQQSLLLNEYRPVGSYSTEIDTRYLSDGVYFCRFQIGEYSIVQKIQVVH